MLPILQPHAREARAQLEKSPGFMTELSAVKSMEVGSLSMSELWRRGGRLGSFYQALANVLETGDQDHDDSQGGSSRRSRERRQPFREGFVAWDSVRLSSSSEGHPSSSPPEMLSSSSYIPGEDSELIRETHEGRYKSEVATSTLAFLFLSSTTALTRGNTQDPQLEFLNLPTTFLIAFKDLKSTCINDGSLLLRGMFGGSWVTSVLAHSPCWPIGQWVDPVSDWVNG